MALIFRRGEQKRIEAAQTRVSVASSPPRCCTRVPLHSCGRGPAQAKELEKELAAVKEKITRLNAEKQAARQIYDGACLRLGVENDLAKTEEENGTLTDE